MYFFPVRNNFGNKDVYRKYIKQFYLHLNYFILRYVYIM